MKKTVCAFLVVLFVALLCCSCSAAGHKRRTTVLKIGNEKISQMEFQICYHVCYSNFAATYDFSSIGFDEKEDPFAQTCRFDSSRTWGEFLLDSTVSFCRELVIMAAEAKARNLSLSAQQEEQIEESIRDMQEQLKKDGTEENVYWAAVYGADATAEDVITVMKKIALYRDVYAALVESFGITEAQLADYYQQNRDILDAVTLRIVPFEYGDGKRTASEAKQAAKEFIAGIKSEQDIVENAGTAVSSDVQSYFGDTDFTLTYNVTREYFGSGSAASRWLFSEKREYMESNVYDTGTMWLAMFYIEADTRDYKTVTLRHILLADKTESGAEKANQVYEEWKKNYNTEAGFAAFATIYSQDADSRADGGLYANVYKGQLVNEMTSWGFDPKRKPGDTAVVRSSYGYHILYFVSEGEETYRNVLCRTAIEAERYTAFMEEKQPSFPTDFQQEDLRFVFEK